jgi:predicted PurR-regulated permease PerM
MEDLVVKYAFTYGPLMIFFFAVGFAVYKAAPVLMTVFREVVAALNSSTLALNNSTQALNENSAAAEKHQQSMQAISTLWDEMRDRLDSFHCPYSNSQRSNKIVTLAPPVKKAQSATR